MNKKLLKWAVLLFLLIVSNSYSDEMWHVIYSGPESGGDAINGLVIDDLNNIYVAGFSEQSGYSETITTAKYNSSGSQQWMQLYPSTGSDAAYDIAKDDRDNIYVTGERNWSGPVQCFLLKYNKNGDLKWYRYVNTAFGRSVKVDHHSNVIVAGYSYDSNENYDLLLLKYDSTGNLLWTRSYDNPSHGLDVGDFVSIDYLDNIIVAGYTENGPTYEYSDFLTVKYSPDGILLWVKTHDGAGHSLDELLNLFVDRYGNSYVTGASWNLNLSSDCVTVKYGPDGTMKWDVAYNGPGNLFDAGFDIITDRNLNVYVTGASTMSSAEYDEDYVTIKYDSNGVQKWIRFYDGTGNTMDEAAAIALDSNDNIYVCGRSMDEEWSVTALKYSPNGALQRVEKYDPPGNHVDNYLPAIGIDRDGNLIVAGRIGSSDYTDMLTIKFAEIVNVSNNQNIAPSQFALHQNYPNPFNPVTTIIYELPVTSYVKLDIYNMLGKEVALLVNRQLQPGTYEVEWDASNYPSGVYFYKLIAGDYSETKKMILIK